MGDRPELLHAYGVVAASAELPTHLSGIDARPVTVLRVGELGAIVSTLPAETFGPAVWEARAEDLRWVGQVARQHHEVLQAVADRWDVLPFRLPSMYSSEEACRHAVEACADGLQHNLERIAGRREWAIKLYHTSQAEVADAPSVTSGRDYLEARSGQLRARTESEDKRRRLVGLAHERMEGLADEAMLAPVQDSAMSGRAEPMVLNGAYLVRRADEGAFLSGADRLGLELKDAGLALEVTGPWPPYSFAAEAEPERGETA